jgi:hypothetical protein
MYILYILSCDIEVDEIILPINLRSFSPQWDYNPMFQCMSHIYSLKALLTKNGVAMDKLKINSLKTVSDFFRSNVSYLGSQYNYIYDFQNILMSNPKTDTEKSERKKNIFIYHYMNKIQQQHHKFEPLKNMIELCNKRRIKLFVYLTPINFEGGERFVGKAFMENVRANTAIVSSKILNAMQDAPGFLSFKDFSLSLTSEFFFSREETTEHLNEDGRKLLAENIIKSI